MRELTGFLVFVFAVYGLANAIAVLKIGRFFFGTYESRKFLGRIPYLGDLFYCPPCVGFWVGMAFSVGLMSAASPFVAVWWKAMILDGLAASGVVYLAHVTAERLSHNLGI